MRRKTRERCFLLSPLIATLARRLARVGFFPEEKVPAQALSCSDVRIFSHFPWESNRACTQFLLDEREKFRKTERLEDAVQRAFGPPIASRKFSASRKQYDSYGREAFLHDSQKIDPASAAWKSSIRKDQGNMLFFEQFNGGIDLARLMNAVSRALEKVNQQFPQVIFVLHHEDSPLYHAPLPVLASDRASVSHARGSACKCRSCRIPLSLEESQ